MKEEKDEEEIYKAGWEAGAKAEREKIASRLRRAGFIELGDRIERER